MNESPNIEIFLKNNSCFLSRLRNSWRCRLVFLLNPRIKQLYEYYKRQTGIEQKNKACADVLNAFEESIIWRTRKKIQCLVEDLRVFFRQFGKRETVDFTPRDSYDYYSVVVIVKNVAKYIREYILFYQATGADRIYLYDNDSEDNLYGMIESYVKSGFVVYRKWPGCKVQTAAYRDAVRRTKNKTKWLAIIDSDEFLFSPGVLTSAVLRNYEEYPGIGVNWVMFGPNGHDKSPRGLVMDNYVTTLKEQNSIVNCHIKSVVQPAKVSCVYHTHCALYKNNRYAVDSNGNKIDNYAAYLERAGRAFTQVNHRDILRINHYYTKSLEDLAEKCARGYSDGAPNANYLELLRIFDLPLVEDYTIKPFADVVRVMVNEKE